MLLFEDYKFEKINVNDGLSQNTVYSIVQDKKGFIWISTQQGLNRFNGYSFTIYKNQPLSENSLPHNYIGTSFRDSDDKIWFGSLNGVFFSYNEDKNYFNRFNIPVTEDLKNAKNQVTCICENGNKFFYISSSGLGVTGYDKIKNKFFDIDNDFLNGDFNLNDSKSLFYDDEDVLWAGTWNDGLIKTDFKNKIQTQYLYDSRNENSISNNRIKFIFKDIRKNMWIGTADGLNLYDPVRKNFKRFLTGSEYKNKNVLTCIAEDKNSNLWIGTINSGLIKYDVLKDKFSMINANMQDPTGLSSDAVISLYSDSSNVLWIGTFNDGLNKLDCERKKFYNLNHLIDSKKHNTNLSISSILKDHCGNIFFGTDFEGLFKINFQNSETENFHLKENLNETRKDQTVLCLYEDKKNNIWTGTLKYGLYKFSENSNTSENYVYSDSAAENKIHSISIFNKLSDDYLWIGTLTHGLFRFDKIRKEFCEYSSLKKFNRLLNSKEIKCLLLDKSGILWIGTDLGGLNRMDYEKGLISNYLFDKKDTRSLSDNYVVSICEDKNENIWIGTMNGGLNKFDREKKTFKSYNIEQGLPGNTICGITEDDAGNLWLSTNNGISKFNPDSETFRNYDISDGLQSKEFNDGSYFKDKDGVIYFGGVNGFNFFIPEEIKDNPYTPNIVITDFQIFNQSIINSPDSAFLKKNITETREIILSYRESVFSFEFAALIYNKTEKNQYAYMMEGFDKQWIYCGTRRFATYTNLQPGDYYFRVKGSNNDGIWNENGTSVKITITPPFWKRFWFKTLVTLSVAGATGISYRKKLSKIEKQKKSQEEFSKKLIDTEEKERKRISKELHDSIAHDILIAKNKAELGIKKFDNPEVKKVLNEISDLSSRTLNDVRRMSNHLHPQILEKLGLTKAIKSVIKNVSSSTGIRFTELIENIDDINSQELSINIFRIIQECTNNIIKHSGATKASVNILKDNKTLMITVWDNGKGISKNRIDGLGINGIEERVKLYKGEFVIESAHTKGTIIAISIPYKTNNK